MRSDRYGADRETIWRRPDQCDGQLWEGFAGIGDQAHPVSAQFINTGRNQLPCTGQSRGSHVFGQHALGNVHCEDQVDAFLLHRLHLAASLWIGNAQHQRKEDQSHEYILQADAEEPGKSCCRSCPLRVVAQLPAQRDRKSSKRPKSGKAVSNQIYSMASMRSISSDFSVRCSSTKLLKRAAHRPTT